MDGLVVAQTLQNLSTMGEVWGSNPTNSTIIFTPTITECHMAAHAYATRHHTIFQKMLSHVINIFTYMSTKTILTCHLPTHRTVMPRRLYGPTTSSCRDYRVNKFFAYLEKWKGHDMSLIRCPFEPILIELGLWGRCLWTCPFLRDSKHFDFWAKFDPWPKFWSEGEITRHSKEIDSVRGI